MLDIQLTPFVVLFMSMVFIGTSQNKKNIYNNTDRQQESFFLEKQEALN